MRIIKKIVENTYRYHSKPAFVIEGKHYSYELFRQRIATITNKFTDEANNISIVGIDASDIANFETYCQIFACLIAGKCFVPLNFNEPPERLKYFISKSGIQLLLVNNDTEQSKKVLDLPVIKINTEQIDPFNEIKVKEVTENEIAYLLFTSGSTGMPKGVPLTRKNLFEFTNNIKKIGFEFNESDKFLQVFDLNFDFSLFTYFIPIVYGASVHPVESKGIKLSNTLRILFEDEITVSSHVPSFLSILKPYYEEISLPSLRYLFFCGEALSNELTFEFSKCVPHARIVNFYGPTEATIFCTYYEWKQELMNIKHHNGSVSIGKAFPNMLTVILDEQNKVITQPNIIGELCLAGNQLTPGYYKNDEKNKTSFVELIIDGNNHRLYRTGDLAFYDKDGDIMFVGRKDFQIKIQGYRIELGEIEYTLRKLLNNPDVVVVSRNNKNDITELHAFIKGIELNKAELKAKVSEVLPAYMLPTDYHFIKDFPLNNNGKIDRNKLKEFVI